MFKRYQIRAMLCMVLALAMVFDIVIAPPAQAKVTGKQIAAGVGIGLGAFAIGTLAGPAICSGVAAAGGAIVGTVGALGGALLSGAAAVVTGIGGLIGGVVSAVGGVIAAIVSSPIFIPALVITAAAIAGYLAYKAIYKKGYKDGQRDANSTANDNVIEDAVYVAPTDYEMSSTIPEGDSPVSLGTSYEIITIASSNNTVTESAEAPKQTTAAAAVEEAEASGETNVTNSASVEEAYLRYKKAYNNYTSLVTNSGGADSATINAAMKEYREAWTEYETLKGAAEK